MTDHDNPVRPRKAPPVTSSNGSSTSPGWQWCPCGGRHDGVGSGTGSGTTVGDGTGNGVTVGDGPGSGSVADGDGLADRDGLGGGLPATASGLRRLLRGGSGSGTAAGAVP